MNNTSQIITEIRKQNIQKMDTNIVTTLLKSILAGMFIGIGGTAAIKVSVSTHNPFLSAFVFTIGFVLIITLGVQLFTSNSLMSFNLLSKEVKIQKVLHNWTLVWFGNLVGTFLVALLVFAANGYTVEGLNYMAGLVDKKVSLTFQSAILLGIGCNMIIVLTVMLVNATKDYTAKIIVAVFGVMIFLLSGYEHVVANMYYMAFGVLTDVISISDAFINNLLPVTIGNIIGGALVIPVLFHYSFKENTK